MLGIEGEAAVFLQALLSGGIVFLVYCCIRIVRRLVKHSLFFISIEDFCFWIGTGLYLFIRIYDTSDGSIRWFFVIGVITGLLLLYSMGIIVRKIYTKIHKKKID